jgi:protease-4
MSTPNSPSAPQTTQASAGSPIQINPPKVVVRPSGFARFFSWLGWLGLLICIPVLFSMASSHYEYFNTTSGIQEKFHSLSETAEKKIAVINVTGAIMRGEGGFVRKQIERVRQDDNVKGIVLRVNSPGGSVSASDYILHHLNELRNEKDVPLVVSMGDLAASGGYYVSMAVGDQGKSIYAEPTTTTGSIGVIVPHYDLSGMLAMFNVRDDSIVSHPRKQLLSMTRPPDEENREIVQAYVDQAFARFKEIVQSGRPAFREDPQSLDELATGEIFAAEQAAENGLVDEIGFIEDAIDRVIELAGLDKDSVRVIKYTRRATLLDAIGLAEARTSSHTISAIDLFTPRAYYLWSTLPSLVE